MAVPGLKGFLCPQSWVEPLSVTLDSECHVKACGLIVLAWQKVQISEDLYIWIICIVVLVFSFSEQQRGLYEG